jgi:two-component system, response regulator PdtaR
MTQHPIRFLIVEDEVLIAMSLELELKRADYGVCQCVPTGEEAVSFVASDPPDVILMDIRLAGKIDGIEAARQIQAIHDIPIIFMTGYSDNTLMEEAQQLHPLGYFIKPITIRTLRSAVESWFARKAIKNL